MTIAMLFTASVVTVLVAVGTELLRSRAHRWGLIDVPNERSLHSEVTPRGGGIVLVATVLAGLAVLVASGIGEPGWHAAAFAGGSLLLAAVGWRDDLRSLAPVLKFAAHIAAAACAVMVWGTFGSIHVPGAGTWALAPEVATVATVLWIVGLVNAYNFMDGVDGIASGQAVIAGSVWMWAAGTYVPLAGAIGLLVAAASAGFLWHNRPPARIFLGDAGSGFLGFTFAALPLVAYHATLDPRMPTAGVLVMAPFVFDTLYTLCRRALRGENVIRPHRTHLYQRLVIGGWSHARVTTLYLAIGAAAGIAAAAWLRGATPLLAAPALVAVVLLPVLVAAVERPGRSSGETART